MRVLFRGLRFVKAVTKAVITRSVTSVSLQSILLAVNICFFYAGEGLLAVSLLSLLARLKVWCHTTTVCNRPSKWASDCCAGVKKLRQARFATAVRLLTELDEDGLKFCVNFLPAWVKVSPKYNDIMHLTLVVPTWLPAQR